MDHTIVHFEIPAKDPEKLADFYRQVFGWEITKLQGPIEYYGVRTTETDDSGMPKGPGLNGGICRKMNPGHSPVNYVGVTDIESHSAKLEAAGAKVILSKMAVPGMGWLVQFLDPEGNIMALWQTDHAAA